MNAINQVIRKANPTGSQVHVNQPLIDISTAYIQDNDTYVANKVFPTVNVKKQNDLFYQYDKGDFYRISAEKRAPGSESAGGGYDLTRGNYRCDVWSFHEDISDQDRDNEDTPLDSDRDATEHITQVLMMRKEVEFFSNFFTTSIWGAADFTPSTLWDAADSTPIVDIESQIAILIKTTGMSKKDFTLTMGYDVWTILKNHPEVIDRIKYTTKENPTLSVLASFLEIKEVIVGQAVKNTAVKGATTSMAFIATAKSCLLSYAPPRGALKKPSAGYVFNWSGYRNVGSAGTKIKKFRMEPLESDRIEGSMSFDMKLVSSDAGRYFDGVIS